MRTFISSSIWTLTLSMVASLILLSFSSSSFIAWSRLHSLSSLKEFSFRQLAVFACSPLPFCQFELEPAQHQAMFIVQDLFCAGFFRRTFEELVHGVERDILVY